MLRRKGWDSNPGTPLGAGGFRDRCDHPLCHRSRCARIVAAAVPILLALTACVTGWPIGYSREAPMAIYPAGELSGPPTWFVGWRWRL